MMTASRWRRWGLLIPWLPLLLLQVKDFKVYMKDNSTDKLKELITPLSAPPSALPGSGFGGRKPTSCWK